MAMTPAQHKQMAQAEMAARQKEELARPKSGKPGPSMPVMQMPAPRVSAARKFNASPAKRALVPIDQVEYKRAPVPMEQVEIDKAKQIAATPQPSTVSKPAPPPMMTPTTAAPSNLSNAIGQLKAGNVVDAKNSLRQSVGLPTVPNMKSGGKVSASSRGDGIAKRGKTKGRYI